MRVHSPLAINTYVNMEFCAILHPFGSAIYCDPNVRRSQPKWLCIITIFMRTFPNKESENLQKWNTAKWVCAHSIWHKRSHFILYYAKSNKLLCAHPTNEDCVLCELWCMENWWVLDRRINSIPESKLIKPVFLCNYAAIVSISLWLCTVIALGSVGFFFFLCLSGLVCAAQQIIITAQRHKCSGRWLLFLPLFSRIIFFQHCLFIFGD